MNICFLASSASDSIRALDNLSRRYGNCPQEIAKVIVALGGDGFMLETMHEHLGSGIPIYGIHCGSVGFLMNEYPGDDDDLVERIEKARPAQLYPLAMEAKTQDHRRVHALAFNEVSLLRETRQAAKLKISVDGTVRLPELVCDGALVSTPAGSTAYNLSAHGPILPIGSKLLALTPISAFRPRRWKGALLPDEAVTTFDVLESKKRPVSAVADFTEVRDVVSVSVKQHREKSVTVLFDRDHHLDERILQEQFLN